MKKYVFGTAALLAVCGLGYFGTWVSAQNTPATPMGGAVEKPTMKIGYLNIAKVIKEFKKANAMGDKILADAQNFEKELKTDQEVIKAEEAKLKVAPTDIEKETIRKRMYQLQMTYSEKDLAYQKDIRKRRDDMLVEVNKDVQRIIDSLARHMGLELVLSCPDVPTKEEVGTLSDAMRRISAQAVWVAWKHPGMDMTDEAVRWLNHYCPSPAGAPVTPAGGPMMK